MIDLSLRFRNSQRRLPNWLLPTVVFLFFGTVTIAISRWQSEIQSNSNEISNTQISATMTTEIRDRLRLHGQFLRSLNAFASANPNQGLPAWRRYAERTDITGNLSGLFSFAYAMAVSPAETEKFVFSTRQQVDRSNFHIFPESSDKLTAPIMFAAPENTQLRAAIGFDLLSEPTRRQAINTAITSRDVAITGPIFLVADTTQRPAFMLLHALYQPNLPLNTVSQRHAAFSGVVLTAYFTDDFFATLKHDARSNFALKIFDETLASETTEQTSPTLIFDSDPNLKVEPEAQIYHHEIDFGGRNWILEFRPRAHPTEHLAFDLPSVILYGGLLSNALFALLVFNLGTHRERAERYASEVTSELRQHRDHLHERVAERTASLDAALQRVRAASAAKSEFLANMSHELRTPMHAVLSFSQLGSERAEIDGQAKLGQYFQRIEQSATRLLDLINELLDLTKLESGRSDLALAPTDLAQLLHQASAQLESLLLAHKLQIEIVTLVPDSAISADATRLTQVIFNLLSNAIKFSPEQSTIRIELDSAELPFGRRAADNGMQPAMAIRFIDSGVGIPAGELDSIFEKFEQSSATRTGAGGTGLGLAITRAIVLQHRGTIVANNNIGGGACFTVTLPIDSGIGAGKT